MRSRKRVEVIPDDETEMYDVTRIIPFIYD